MRTRSEANIPPRPPRRVSSGAGRGAWPDVGPAGGLVGDVVADGGAVLPPGRVGELTSGGWVSSIRWIP
nr:hypothetical protein GCM10020241_30640 [Streptoalloteichus tenebrarius]